MKKRLLISFLIAAVFLLSAISPVLANGTTTTTVSDPRYGVDSIVFFTGYNETLEHSYPFVKSTSTNGSMIIEHKNHGHDVDVAYLIIG